MACFLVDFENVNSVGLGGINELTEEDSVYIFYTNKANSLTFSAHKAIMKSKAKIEYVPVLAGGKNALDFQLSSFLGYCISSNFEKEYYIISNDTGFDFVRNFWNGKEESGNSGIRRTVTIKKAMADMHSRALTNELESDEMIHEAYVKEKANEPVFDFIAAAETEMVYELPEVPVMQPNEKEEKKNDIIDIIENFSTEHIAEETQDNAEEQPPKKAVVKKTARTRKKAVTEEKTVSPEEVTSETSPAEEEASQQKTEETAEKPKKKTKKKQTEKKNVKVNEKEMKEKLISMGDGTLSSEDIDYIYNALRESNDKQKFYHSFINRFGMEKGVTVYKFYKSEFLNLRKNFD